MTTIDKLYDETSQETLNRRATFSLGEHELISPEIRRGEVVSALFVDTLEFNGRQVPVSSIRVRDPFVSADPKGYEIVTNYIENVIEPLGEDCDLDYRVRTEAQSGEERNRLTRAWLHGDTLQALSIWRENVPTALALDYLTNPMIGRKVESPNGEVEYASPETAAHWRFVKDAIGIRTRAEAMSYLASTFLARDQAVDQSKNMEWISLASGTAEPSLQAGIKAITDTGRQLDMTVADWDGRALRVVDSKSKELNFEKHGGTLNTVKCNILDPELPEILAEESHKQVYDVVENMGFEEYLPQDGDTISARKGAGLPQASSFTKTAFELVKPGGMLISGNMVLPRPQIDFVFNAVDWPLINARTEEDMLRVYDQAGILKDPDAKITMHRIYEDSTNTHIYNIVTVEKLI